MQNKEYKILFRQLGLSVSAVFFCSVLTGTADADSQIPILRSPENFSESFRIAANLPAGYLHNKSEVSEAVTLANYSQYAASVPTPSFLTDTPKLALHTPATLPATVATHIARPAVTHHPIQIAKLQKLPVMHTASEKKPHNTTQEAMIKEPVNCNNQQFANFFNEPDSTATKPRIAEGTAKPVQPQLAANLPWLTQSKKQKQSATESPPADAHAEVATIQPVDRNKQPLTHQLALDLPWLAQNKPSEKTVNAAPVQVAMMRDIKIEPLTSATTAVLVPDNTPTAPSLPLAPSFPPPLPIPLVSAPEAKPGTGLSDQSKSIVAKLPPERAKTEETQEPVAIKHVQPNALEQETEIKKHNGVGIHMSIKQPKANITKMLEDAYDALIAGNQTEAVDLYKQVLETQPANKLALFGLATTYHRAGQIQLARPLYGRLLAIDPYNVEGLNNFLVLLSDEDPHDALAELAKLQRSHPQFSPIPAQMAVIYEKTGDYNAAIEKMNTAMELSPENLKYRYNMAIILDKKGDWADAAVLYQQLLTAYERGEKISANPEEIQQRLTFILSNKPRG